MDFTVAVTNQSTTLTFAPPVVTGGASPVSVTCTPSSGSSVSIGTTRVTCVASDAQSRTDTCVFNATVQLTPQLSLTRFVAFGDSITEGKLGTAIYEGNPQFPNAYVGGLYLLLTQRYSAQSFDVFNRGLGGEQVQPNGVARLSSVLAADNPRVLLLLEGVNDLSAFGAAGIPNVINGLRTMIRQARGRGVEVFLGTLLPQRRGGPKAGAFALIAPTNDQIRALAISEGVFLVDVYQAFGGSADPWIDADGLHPNAQGYLKMATTFFDVIRSSLEVTNRVAAPGFEVFRGPSTAADRISE